MEKQIHLIRWNEIPDFPLYIDQVLSMIEDSLSFLKFSEKDTVITNSMVNNYVKHHIVPSPTKKKYIKIHVTSLIIVTLLKQVYTLEEIDKLLKILLSEENEVEAYNNFCDRFEEYMIELQNNEIINDYDNTDLINVFNKVVKSVVYKIYVQNKLNEMYKEKDED